MIAFDKIVTYGIDEMKEMAPSMFTTTKAAHLTDKYIQTPTIKVVKDLMKLGWEITKVQEVKARKSAFKGFQKHLIVFRHPDIKIKGKGDDISYPQILLTNSHDGKNAFNFRIGIFRMICSNGLVICSNEFNNLSIRHMNYTFKELQERITEVVNKLPGLVKRINLFKKTILTQPQMLKFANDAAALRSKQKINALDLLKATRSEDEGNNLWNVFNRIQEKILAGDFVYGNKKRKARTIKNFQQDIKINEELYQLAEIYL